MLDPRGPRFAAALTTLVVLVAMTFSSGWVMLAQAVVFGLTALAPRFGPYGLVYKTFVAPRLSRPTELEPSAPVRFAQTAGLVFALVSGIGYLLGAPVVGLAAAAFALAAAFLNAAFLPADPPAGAADGAAYWRLDLSAATVPSHFITVEIKR